MSGIHSAPTAFSIPGEQTITKRPPRPSRRRDKVQLSCNLCRRRKYFSPPVPFILHIDDQTRLKCDRNLPWETCINRRLSVSCTYIDSTGQHGMAQSRPPQSSSNKIQERINQLEKLVISLMSTLKTKESDSKIEPLEPASKFLQETETRPIILEEHSQTLLALRKLCGEVFNIDHSLSRLSDLHIDPRGL